LFMREELIRKLEQAEGFPEGAEYRTELSPPCWLWQFAVGAWVHFGVRDHPGFLGIGRSRDVVIFRITSDRPV
jgi:hypothetical protein